MLSLIKTISDPYILLHLVLGGSLLLALRKREIREKWSVRSAVLAWGLLYCLSLPFIGEALLRTVEVETAPASELEQGELIMVFGGGTIPPEDSEDATKLTMTSLQRCHAAWLLYRLHPCPILLAGGKVREELPGTSEAEAMAILLKANGIPEEDILLETRSKSTYENVKYAAPIIKKHGAGKVILVSHSEHLKRASACLEKQGIIGIPHSCNSGRLNRSKSFQDYCLPQLGAFAGSQAAAHEWLGMIYYYLRGWL